LEENNNGEDSRIKRDYEKEAARLKKPLLAGYKVSLFFVET